VADDAANLEWPIEYETNANGVPMQRGVLDGIYYRDDEVVRRAPVPGV
jgi:hypothetical protein